jgi:LmbE family N-acetylglucosaminyl deacetylase
MPDDTARALVIAAHPDDIEAFAGGTVALLTQLHVEVTFALATQGESGINDLNIAPEQVRKTRIGEQERAAEVLGVDDVVWLEGTNGAAGFGDGELVDSLELRLALVRLIRARRPDLVLTFDPLCVFDGTYVNHADHRALGAAAVAATWPAAANPRYHPELVDAGLPPHFVRELWLMMTLAPTHAVDIGGVIQRKVQALAAHQSQLDDVAAIRRRVHDEALRAGAAGGVGLAERFARVRINASTDDPLAVSDTVARRDDAAVES